MCYLRNFTPIQQTFQSKQELFIDSETDLENYNKNGQNFNVDFYFSQNQKGSLPLKNDSNILMNLLKLMQKNSEAIQNLSMKIDQNCNRLNQIQQDQQTKKLINPLKQSQIDTEQSNQQAENCFKTQQILTQKLFGENKQYKYKLVLAQAFPDQIFKERNFNFDVRLIDKKQNPIRNSNIIHLCLGVCDTNGVWVTETKAKESLMKGKTQSQLYHGQGSYNKIYFRDVSRHYPEGRLNIIIYPKQSILKYCQGTNFLQESVNWQQIQPLIIENLSVKAKKKQ